MQCKKCGAELHPDQKVCIQCGARTEAGGAYHVEQEEGWKPSRQLIRNVIVAVAVVILAIVLVKALHVDPPEKVADEWFSALSGRDVRGARQLVTEGFMQDLQGRNLDLGQLSDDYNTQITLEQGKYTVSAPRYTDSSHVSILISVTHDSGQPGRDINLQLYKQGRRWYVSKVM